MIDGWRLGGENSKYTTKIDLKVLLVYIESGYVTLEV
jgi:hypothetical protein